MYKKFFVCCIISITFSVSAMQEKALERFRTSRPFFSTFDMEPLAMGIFIDPQRLSSVSASVEKRIIRESDTFETLQRKIRSLQPLSDEPENIPLREAVKQRLKEKIQADISHGDVAIGTSNATAFSTELIEQASEILEDTEYIGPLHRVNVRDTTCLCCFHSQENTRVLTDDYKSHLRTYLTRQDSEKFVELSTTLKKKYLIADHWALDAGQKYRQKKCILGFAIMPIFYLLPIAEATNKHSPTAILWFGLLVAHTIVGCCAMCVGMSHYVQAEQLAHDTGYWKNMLNELNDICIEEQKRRDQEYPTCDELV